MSFNDSAEAYENSSLDFLQILTTLEMVISYGEQDAIDDFLSYPQVDNLLKLLVSFLIDQVRHLIVIEFNQKSEQKFSDCYPMVIQICSCLTSILPDTQA